MTDEEPAFELPNGWTATTYELTGNFKLVAEFEHQGTGAEVRVRPYRSYSDVPGFCDCHRVILIRPQDGVEEIAVGLELEYVEDAKQAALDAMEQV